MRRALAALTIGAVACGGGKAFEGPDAGSGSVVVTADGGPDAGPIDAGPVDAGPIDAGPADAGPLGGGDWRQYRYDGRGGSSNPGVFAASEVANLRELWPAVELGQYAYTQAVAGDGLVVYTTAFSGKVVAIDAATGARAWPTDVVLNAPVVTACGGSKQTGFWAAAAIVDRVVYVASPDGNAYALRAADGSVLWSARVADPTAAGHGEFVQSSPAVSTAFGRLFLGVASSAHCDEVAGRIVAVDLATGAVQSQSLVAPGQQGATIWSSIAIAEDEGRLYATTGNRIGPASAEPNAQAFLALDPHSLQVLDRWQNPTPLENADFGSSPALAEAGGLKVVAATSKDGNLYVLNRERLSAGPIWTYPIATIDPSNPTVGGDPSAGFGSISTPVFANGLLYAAGGRTPGGAPGQVVAFHPQGGAPVWQTNMPGFVLGPIAAAGEILVVAASAPDGASSTLLVLDARTGAILRTFPGSIATYAGPSIARGAIFWTTAFGHAVALGAPAYRR